MKSIRVFFVSLVFIGLTAFNVLPQEVELETYYGEKKGFKIDLPAEWSTALDESRDIVNILLSMDPSDLNTSVKLTVAPGYGLLSAQQKAYTKETKKQAKKRKDKNYAVLEEGKGEVNGEKYIWHTWKYSLAEDDGSVLIKTVKTCILLKGVSVYILEFQTTSDQWESRKAVFNKILDTLHLKEKK
jgi:hypothetical protein